MDTRRSPPIPLKLKRNAWSLLLWHSAKNGPNKDLAKGDQDAGKEQPKPEPRLAIKDPGLEKVVAELVASGELTGKAFETVCAASSPGLQSEKALVVGAGKAKSFTHAEVRKAAGSALRALKPK